MVRKSNCRYCSKLFTFRPNKEYCSDICRSKAWREGIDVKELRIPCYYCGVPADSIDHVPPKSVRERIIQSGLSDRYPFVEIDSCRECNAVIGARTLWTLSERKKFIKRALRRRYAKFLRIPEWSPTELMKMGDRSVMRRFIENGIIVRDITLERIKW